MSPERITIAIHPELEIRLRARAEAEGLTVEAYVERLVCAEQQAEEELEALALQGLHSGEPIEIGPGYWEDKHRRLDERLNETGTR
jgi:hypothetical protein